MRSLSNLQYEVEAVGEGEDEGHVAHEDEGVRLEDGGEHVDVDGDGGVGDDADEEEVQLHEGEEEGEGGHVTLEGLGRDVLHVLALI